MNLTLLRKRFELYGVFGELSGESGELIAVTLEHSYSNVPKLPNGSYTCVRGVHRLEGKPWFETFEITGVPGHTNILFHCGNTNNDSAGCVLLGSYLGTCCILDSREAFKRFLEIQEGTDTFILTVK